MKLIKAEKNGVACAIVQSSEKVITDAQSALDLLMTAKYEAGTQLKKSKAYGIMEIAK